MSDWTPDPVGVNNILEVLRNTQNPDTNIQRHIHQTLQQFQTIQGYNRYLMFIFVNALQEPEYVRSCAGILLKNNLYRLRSLNQKIPNEELIYLKNQIIKVLGDREINVRRVCGTLITTFIGIGTLREWPGILEFLVSCLDSTDKSLVSGAFNALEKICEDHTYALSNEVINNNRPVNVLLPKFLGLFNNTVVETRYMALGCIIKFIHVYPEIMSGHKHNFIEGFFFLGRDSNFAIRRRAVTAFLLMTEYQVEDLIPYIPKLVELLLECIIQQTDEDLALEAMEFWSIIVEFQPICIDYLGVHLHTIFPVLLSRMVYSQQDLLDLGITEQDDANIPDNPKDIQPTFMSSHSGRGKDNDEDESEYDYNSHWNIRKGAAEALDHLACVFRKDTLPPLLPLFESGFKSANWLTRESCILGLGCIASGCSRDMVPHLPTLVPYLFNLLSDEKPLIRSITCWCLSRYSEWISKQKDKESYLNRLMMELIQRMRDQNKRVQKAATSAIAQVIDNSQKLDIMPYIEAIAQSFNNAFRSFQKGNMAVLYDATISVAAVLRGDMNKDPFREYLLQPLLHKWESMGDDDMDLFPLLECLSHIAIYMGSAFVNYCKPIFDRSLRLIEMVLLGNALHLQDTNHAMPNREFLICSLDMISALCDALRGSIEPLINSSKLIPLLIEICKESSPDYCQSAFALVGDIAKHTTNTLPSASPVLIPLLIKGTSSRYYEAANNAVWALGEIIIKVGPDIVEPHAENIYKAVLDVFSTAEEERMLETCSVTIGRLGINFPNILAPNLKGIFKQMCNSLRPLPNESSKLDAIRGLCEAVLKNPRDILHNFESFCDLIAGVNDASLEGVFGPLLQGFKNAINPNEWNQKIESFKPGTKNTLRKKYNL